MADLVKFLAPMLLLFGGGIWLHRWLSGWHKLENEFDCDNRARIKEISRGSYRWVGGSSSRYKLAFSVEIYSRFLWLRPGFPLSLGMKSLCIPWDAIEKIELKCHWFTSQANMTLKNIDFAVCLTGDAARQVYEVRREIEDGEKKTYGTSLHTDVSRQ